MKLNAVIIPVYKSMPDENEKSAFGQCLKILYRHPICIITYRELDISFYLNQLNLAKYSYFVEYFEKEYFNNIQGYNKIMLSLNFYKRFRDYQFILIYQLDAWVFRDELEYWCKKGFDYIGAPWFSGMDKANPDSEIIGAGNGGFSLRNVSKTITLIKYKRIIVSLVQVYINIFKSMKSIHKIKPFVSLYYYFTSFCPNDIYEDIYLVFNRPFFLRYKVAPPEIATQFSFEINPEILFDLNGRQLPFGCHAWNKNYSNFWSKYIP